MAVGAIEPQFFGELLAGLGLSGDECAEIFAVTDACVTPMLTRSEAANDAHLTARAKAINANGVEQAAPAPRFSRTLAGSVQPPPIATTSLDELGW